MSAPLPDATLLIVRNSRWINWLVDESGGLLQQDLVTHYAIYTPEDCVDIISRLPPMVRLVATEKAR